MLTYNIAIYMFLGYSSVLKLTKLTKLTDRLTHTPKTGDLTTMPVIRTPEIAAEVCRSYVHYRN